MQHVLNMLRVNKYKTVIPIRSFINNLLMVEDMFDKKTVLLFVMLNTCSWYNKKKTVVHTIVLQAIKTLNRFVSRLLMC